MAPGSWILGLLSPEQEALVQGPCEGSASPDPECGVLLRGAGGQQGLRGPRQPGREAGVGGGLSPFLSAALARPHPRVPGLAALRELSRPESEVRWRGLGPGPETPSPCSLVWPHLPPKACEGPSAPGCQPPGKTEREGPAPVSGAPALTSRQLCVRRKGLNLPESLLPPLLGSGSWDGGLERACKRAGVPEVGFAVAPGLGTDTQTRSSPQNGKGRRLPEDQPRVGWRRLGLWVLGGQGRKTG